MGVVYKAYQQRLSRFVALKMIRAGSLAKARRPGQVSDRGRGGRQAAPSQHHPDLRYRRGRGPAVRRSRAPGRGQPGCVSGGHAPAGQGVRAVVGHAGPGHSRRPSGRHHSSRFEAVQRHCSGRTELPRSPISVWPSGSRKKDTPRPARCWALPATFPPSRRKDEPRRSGPAADVYALGAILYEMLDRPAPLQGDDAGGNRDAGLERRPGAAVASPALACSPRPGDDLSQVPGQRASQTVSKRTGAGR